MFRHTFYHSTLKKIVAGFGKIFSSIYVIRTHPSGTEKERIKVPLVYGPAEKFLVRLAEDPDLARGFAFKFPAISFEISALQYDSTRKLNTIKRNVQPIDGNQNYVIRQYQGVPYKITMQLSILSKYVDDANQIVEQILPYFTPAYTITMDSIPGMNYTDDVAITLVSVSMADNYEDDWKQRRNIVWTINFDINAIFYGPVVEKKVVTKVQTDIHAAYLTQDLEKDEVLSSIPRITRITATPESPKDNYQDDDFGYTIDLESFVDGKIYDPHSGTDVDAAISLKPKSVKDLGKVGRPKLA
jgi:hypothetical protein